MARIPLIVLRRYLLRGHVSSTGCLRRKTTTTRATAHGTRSLYASATAVEDTATAAPVSFRKQLKDEAKLRKTRGHPPRDDKEALSEWELTVGIEIHAQLNTARKLFSASASTTDAAPNTDVSLFDLAMPGSMPLFQPATLIPAIRGALSLNCAIQHTSRFDRKHYFHWDQPAGYQITQFYEPFAKDGYITLYKHDGIAKEDGEEIRVGIKQVQMEQDTAKTLSQPGDIHLLDFNRVGIPLIEIISLPEIHHPSTAAAFVRKVHTLLKSVDACVLGMQSGGLRADVNVSVRKRNSVGSNSYSGVSGLGQRTEIKNLSSFKAVEDAIIAERDRQISVLEGGGRIEGETRGWTIGQTETRRLRGKEGEVDYRYMPDPDLGPVKISPRLTQNLSDTLGTLPDQELEILTKEYGLTIKDALSLVSLNEGGRCEYFRNVVDELLALSPNSSLLDKGKLVNNWVLHEMGGLVSDIPEDENPLGITDEGCCIITAASLASLIHLLEQKRITGKTAKRVLGLLFESAQTPLPVEEIIEEHGWWLVSMSEAEYETLALSVCESEMKVVNEVLNGKVQKLNFLLGQMMRRDGEGRVQPEEAREILKRVLEAMR